MRGSGGTVRLASCAAFPDGDEDAARLLDALHAHGLRASWAVWDDPSVDWSGGLTVLRATWDYTLRRDEFLAWVHSLPAVQNPADVVAWNSDKIYLHDLAAAGVPVTPTTVIGPDSPPAFPGDAEFVVKPSVGAGSRGAGRFGPGDVSQATEHAAALQAAGRTVLVQPYLADVDDAGETALIYLDGAFSHAVRKGPMLRGGAIYDLDATAGLFVEEDMTARTPSSAELAVGEQALAFVRSRFGRTPLYARIDLLPGPSGPVVIELELIEPSLFLSHGDGAAERVAGAIAARA